VSTAVLLGALGLSGFIFDQHAQAAEAAPLAAARLEAPFADPLVDFDAVMTALNVTVWRDGDARMLLLQGDASFRIGAYGFTADTVVVRIESEITTAGKVWHLAAYFDQARSTAGLGAIRAQGRGLLVTAATLGRVRLEEPGNLTQADTAPANPLINEAIERLSAHRRAADGPGLRVPDTQGLSEDVLIRRQRRRAQIAVEQRQLYEQPIGEALAQTPAEAEPDAPLASALENDASILPARGVVAYSMDSWSAQLGDDETAVSLVGNVRLVFEDFRSGRVVTLRAERIVLFIANSSDDARGFAGSGQLDAGSLSGVYLEDNAIISDGQYTVRAPRVYYDLARNRATLLDAVFYTFDSKRKVPLYVRAEAIRQTSASDFSAENARLTTSAFATPHFSIGAAELRLQQYRTADGGTGQFFTAKGTTLNVGDTPVFYWPSIAARGRDTPLRRIDLGYSSDQGIEIETTWDLFAMLGKARPEGVEAEVKLDVLGDHGLGLGIQGQYATDRHTGEFLGYFLANDSGEDDIGERTVDQDNQQRGVALVRHRSYLPANYEFSLEGAFVSDPTFLEEFYPDDAAAGKPYETSAHLKWQEQEQAFDFLAVTQLSGFVEQLDLLQSRGYSVERYPEASYRVIGGDLFGGAVTWFSQNSFSQLRILGGDDAPEDRGFDNAQSQQFFGINADVSFRDRLNAQGIPTHSVRRIDSRQELSLPLAAGPIDITPYVVGRVTAYDEDFADFNGGNDDQVRLFGEVGVRVGTQFSKADPGVHSASLDLNGIRHIIEPQATVFFNASNLNPQDLPIFDSDVEALAQGSGVRLGVVNTWQTRRGGPGRQRTVDWITLRTDLILRSDDADVDTEIARFFDYRPEYSVGGDHFYAELLWMVTDTLGVAGELTHSLESDRVAQWRLGGTLDHTPRLSSFLAYEEIRVLGSELLTWGFRYQLTAKYHVGFQQTLDFSENDSRQIDFVIDRKLPSWTMRIKVGFDEIDGEQTLGVTLIPDGRRPRGPGVALN